MLDTQNVLILKKSFFTFSLKVFGTVANFLVTFLLAKNLPLSEAGIFFFLLTFFTSTGMIATLGFNTSFLKFIGENIHLKDKNTSNAIYFFGFKLVLLFSLFLSVLIYLFSNELGFVFFQGDDISKYILNFVIFLPIFAILTINAYALAAFRYPIISSFLENTSIVFFFLLFVFFFVDKLDIDLVIIFYILSALLSLIISYIFLSKIGLKYQFLKKSDASKITQTTKLLFFSLILTITISKISHLVSGIYIKPELFAIFMVAVRISSLISFFLSAFNIVVAPKFSELYKKGKLKDLRKLTFFSNRVLFIVGTPIFIIFMIYAEQIIGLFGQEYTQGFNVLRILMFGEYINLITGSVIYLLNMTGFQKDVKNIYIFVGIYALISSFVLIPILGMYGAALSLSSSIIIANILGAIFVRKRLGYNIFLAYTYIK